MIEETHALAQEYMGNAHMQFVEQARLQGLLDRACTVQSHIFIARQFPGFRNRAFNAIGHEVKLCLAFFHGFASL